MAKYLVTRTHSVIIDTEDYRFEDEVPEKARVEELVNNIELYYDMDPVEGSIKWEPYG